MTAQEIIAFIGNAVKKTTVKVTFEGDLASAVPASVTKLGMFCLVIGKTSSLCLLT
ncbi:2%2C3%2C4%2C5-tetrahydropyridine-2%2C6-dicarboxy late N-acetyltransferase [Chlamydia trachomatis]|nr:2%2C3%2C4%2C5-tetrahydropyridine-2%2C6-dicarboxy late N-acetyltransferase [Chlamydia trachomatis]